MRTNLKSSESFNESLFESDILLCNYTSIQCHHFCFLVSFYFINKDQLVILMSDIKDIICCRTVLRRMIIRNILIITVIAALVPTAMSNVSASAGSEIALFSGVSDSDGLSISGNGDTAKMELKATNDNGKTNKVSDYQMNADNVLYIKVGDKVTVEDNVDFTKAITTDGNNNQKPIGITSNGVIDFTGYAQGVSTLDVVVDDDRAYEAVIVIGEHNQDTVKKEITTVNNIQRVTVCEGVIDNQTGACIQDPEPCDEGFVPEGDECVPEPPIPCDEGFVPEGDECVPEPPIPCDEGFVLEGDECVPEPPIPCNEGFVLEGDNVYQNLQIQWSLSVCVSMVLHQ